MGYITVWVSCHWMNTSSKQLNHESLVLIISYFDYPKPKGYAVNLLTMCLAWNEKPQQNPSTVLCSAFHVPVMTRYPANWEFYKVLGDAFTTLFPICMGMEVTHQMVQRRIACICSYYYMSFNIFIKFGFSSVFSCLCLIWRISVRHDFKLMLIYSADG